MRPALRTLSSTLLCSAILLGGCSGGDERTGTATGGGAGAQSPSPPADPTPVADPSPPAEPSPPADVVSPVVDTGNGAFALRSRADSVLLVEGGEAAAVALVLTREAGFDGTVMLAAEPASEQDGEALSWSFDNVRLEGGSNTAELRVVLGIGARPLLPQQRTLRISATDGVNAPVISELVLQVEPTSAPDVYLLVGQSNMVGFSEPGARLSGPGQPDAPDLRIQQLNPTGNDQSNFATPADFTGARIVADPPLSLALDPLHDGFNTEAQSKSGGFIGLGLSFAKAALADTTADILLVPAAWSDTGFCGRNSNLLPGLGWLAQERAEPAFAGTLLHDRAIARTDLALERSGGVLRGILWHQGEADAGDPLCASTYADNLAALVASLRGNIVPDARGIGGRGIGVDADVPFVVGTMSMGTDERGSQLPFWSEKLLVDAAHRGVGESVALAGTVNNDDLVPPAYPCGEGSCVHFGATALREMGARYYRVMRGLLEAR